MKITLEKIPPINPVFKIGDILKTTTANEAFFIVVEDVDL